MKAWIFAMVLACGSAMAGPQVQCEKVAEFSRAIATIKDTGVSEADFQSYVSQPTVQSFPMTLIKHQVYADNLKPVNAYQTFYQKCVTVGYDNLLQSMKDADELVALRDENRLLKSQNAMLVERNNELNRRLEEELLKPSNIHIKPVPVYGTPIGQ